MNKVGQRYRKVMEVMENQLLQMKGYRTDISKYRKLFNKVDIQISRQLCEKNNSHRKPDMFSNCNEGACMFWHDFVDL